MAISWKDKRKELGRLQRSRRFGAASDLKRSYRVEIEELKRRTRCHKCNQVGHWSGECKSSGKGKGKSSSASSQSKTSDPGVALVEPFTENFVAAVECDIEFPACSVLDLLRQRRAQSAELVVPGGDAEIMLVSSPGFGVIDSGRGRTIIGRLNLNPFGTPVESQSHHCFQR